MKSTDGALSVSSLVLQMKCSTTVECKKSSVGFQNTFGSQIAGKFFVRNLSKDLQRKCGTKEFLRFENEFLHFKKRVLVL